MFDIVFLNVLFIILPLLVYLLYIVYENVIGEKGKDLFFAFAIFTSLYLVIKYSIYFDYAFDIIKIILLIVMMKNKLKLSIVVSIVMSIYLSFIYNFDVLFMFISYFIQLLFFFVILKKINIKYKVLVFVIIELITYFLLNNYLIDYSVIINNVIYSLAAYFIVIFLNKTENVIDVYGTIRIVEYEKDLRESLFKVTHEIKNPIAVCKGYIDMMDANDKKQVNKYVAIIKQEIDRTLTLMNDFLNLTKLKVDTNIMDIAMLLDDVCNGVEALLIGKNIHFMFDVVDDEVFIEGDYDRLKQVFINLVKNSVESIDDKIGVIKLSMSVNKNVVITLSDNGCGMNDEVLSKIGDAFYTTKEKGTGLGIKLSTEIIELHNGSIKYRSKVNEGTSVKITLPLIK